MADGLSSSKTCRILGLTRQNLSQSRVGGKIPKTFPFGKNLPLYSARAVAEWKIALLRRRGMIALGRLPKKFPLVKAIDLDDEFDWQCPRAGCAKFAIADKEKSVQVYMDLVNRGVFPRRVWCAEHGIIHSGK